MRKVAIVTGGTRGIGLGIAQALWADGYCVVLNYQNDETNAKQVVAEFNCEKVCCCRADITVAKEREALLLEAEKTFGQVDLLVNNAGILNPHAFLQLTESEYQALLSCNLLAPVFLAQHFASQLIAKKRPGAIVNLLSTGAYCSGNLAYCSSKAALLSASKCMAKDLAPYQIRVNSVSPGAVATKLNEAVRENKPDGWEGLLARTPMQRAATPAEIAGAVVYLASETATYTTGTDIVVDGGFLVN